MGYSPDHRRLKPNRRFPSPHEHRYWESLPDRCVACGASGTVIHHILANIPQKVRKRDHRLVTRLCPSCHAGQDGVHHLGSEELFKHRNGTDLVAIAIEGWERYDG